jgi:CDP-4-dehydro-6-deoxyglucose reductase, E3
MSQMPPTITLQPSGHSFTVNSGETVLEAAMRHDIQLPYGCRNGACGSCKATLAAGQVDYGAHQAATLTDQEKQAGKVLLCCAKPLGDLTVEVRELSAAGGVRVRILPCRVHRMERHASTMVLYLKLPQNERLQFMAGQYLDFLLKDGKRRSFSMANAPHDDEFLQLHVRDYQGLFSGHVFNKMKERDILRIEGPFGSFYLRDSPKPMLLVASGTGFAPIKAIIEHCIAQGVQREMVLYWGNRTRADMYAPELCEGWAKTLPNFRFVPVLSEAKPEDAWTGRTGFVHQSVMADWPDMAGVQVYACGAPVMVDAARREFSAQCGLPEDEFFADSFTVNEPATQLAR